MIELCIKGYCHVCPKFEPVVDRFYNVGNIPYRQTIICAYQSECDAIADYLMLELKKEKTDA